MLKEWRNLIKIFFDCALLDYQLPDSNGIHLLQEILHFGGTSSQIIFVAGKGGETIAAQALKAGALDYISKEKLSPELLSQCIHNVIKVHDLELRANQTVKQYKRIVETISEIIFHWILKEIYLLSIRLSVHWALSLKN